MHDDDDESLSPNINLEKLKCFCKKFTKKVNAAISYYPGSDKDIKLYFFLCKAKKPNYCYDDEDYDKLIRLMHDSWNSIIIYYTKKAKYLTKKLINKFSEIVIYGLHIYGKI